jgi:hypothetical protein
MLTIESYPTRQANTQGRLLENEAVVVLPEQGEIKVLNEVGARIWSLADGTRSVREIAAQISSEYGVARTEAESDTLAFVGEMIQKGMFQAAQPV